MTGLPELRLVPLCDRAPCLTEERAIETGQQALSQLVHLTPEVRELSKLSSWKSIVALGCDWGIICLCFLLATIISHPFVWLVAAIIIASRQHALLILMHDASHFRIFDNRLSNDRLSNWFCAWPLFVSTEGYRQNHFAHHSHLNTEADPDWVRKRGNAEWKFPKSRWRFFALLLRDLVGGGFLDAFRSIRDLSARTLRTRQRSVSAWERVAYYGLIATGVSVANLWLEVLLLWFLPAFTILTVILRLRSIAEHFAMEGDHDLNMSRNTHTRWWEKVLLAPHNSGYHLDHHLFPSVPFYRLPELHMLLRSIPSYAEQSHQTSGFLGGSGSTLLKEISGGG